MENTVFNSDLNESEYGKPICFHIENFGTNEESVFLFDNSFKNDNIKISYKTDDLEYASSEFPKINTEGLVFEYIYLQSENEKQIKQVVSYHGNCARFRQQVLLLPRVVEEKSIKKTSSIKQKFVIDNTSKIQINVYPNTSINIFFYPIKFSK